ncbi:S-layer homology domain-containing protein [Salsuginibacillus kocurii]|uniref:S-layer homology domain-containing protein n=1 Tax=Salsuginibacillus kocurii TaxID=427078 RepID=UPI0003690C51|nr:S-layer homology domain-containing protein [Salsuginibacillus kocurii]
MKVGVRAGCSLLVGMFAVSVGLGTVSETKSAPDAAAFADVNDSHWAYGNIQWGLEEGLIEGYGDGSFRPSQTLTEAEFTTMLTRFYGIENEQETTGSHWADPYYAQLEPHGPPLQGLHDSAAKNQPVLRETLARTFSHLNGGTSEPFGAIRWMYDAGLTVGQGYRQGGELERFDRLSDMTRAEAITFIERLDQQQRQGIEVDTEPQEPWVVQGMAIGDTQSELEAFHGEPERVTTARLGFEWHTYHDAYENFARFGLRDGEVVALSTSKSPFESAVGVQLGMNESEAEALVEEDPSDYRVTLQYDQHQQDKLVAMKVTDGTVNYPTRQAMLNRDHETLLQMEQDYQAEMYDFLNVARVAHGQTVLPLNATVSEVAFQHSLDMAQRNYFSHESPEGMRALQRVREEIPSGYLFVSENISSAYISPFSSHRGLMNSISHRGGILREGVEQVGIGVSLLHGETYYTQNFLSQTQGSVQMN